MLQGSNHLKRNAFSFSGPWIVVRAQDPRPTFGEGQRMFKLCDIPFGASAPSGYNQKFLHTRHLSQEIPCPIQSLHINFLPVVYRVS